MRRSWYLAGLLLGVACASGSPAGHPPAPAPSGGPVTPRPNVDPVRVNPAPVTPIHYPLTGGGVLHYTFHRRDSVAVTMPSGETQMQLLGRQAWLTLTWIAADTGTRITAVVDSIHPDSGFESAEFILDSARSARWVGLRTPDGHVRMGPGSSPSLAAALIRDELALLFPPLPEGGVLPGQSWFASDSGEARVSAFPATEQVQVSAVAGDTLAPDGTLPLALLRTRSASGTGTQFGQPMEVRATGTDTLAFGLLGDGRVAWVSGQRTTDVVVTLPSVGQSVPAREVSVLRFTLLP